MPKPGGAGLIAGEVRHRLTSDNDNVAPNQVVVALWGARRASGAELWSRWLPQLAELKKNR
jgi:hypothetical protein